MLYRALEMRVDLDRQRIPVLRKKEGVHSCIYFTGKTESLKNALSGHRIGGGWKPELSSLVSQGPVSQ